MKFSTPRAIIAAAIATAFIGVSATAIAQGMNGTEPDMHKPHTSQRAADGANAQPGADKLARHAQRAQRMEKRMAEHQAKLKTELQLSADQEPAWNAFVARMQPDMSKRTPIDREAWSKLTTPERLDKMAALKAERDGEMAKRSDAIKSFYAALKPEQQKTFDNQRMGFHRAGMKGEHRMGHGHKGHGHMGGKDHPHMDRETTPAARS
ncbi:Spy/CpxP family protein refolding chaperone [Hydrogenophaga sp.]|uniref:Spy/CpxP family protein refolding chaperone n=1 Tax=Hydrogenophaga sp. TaxID=1904254 RepID=UPI0035696286